MQEIEATRKLSSGNGEEFELDNIFKEMGVRLGGVGH